MLIRNLGIMRLCVKLIANKFLDVNQSGGLKPLSLGFQRWKGVTFIRDGLYFGGLCGWRVIQQRSVVMQASESKCCVIESPLDRPY